PGRAGGDRDRGPGDLVAGRGLPPGILGRRRPAKSVLPGGDPAQAGQAAQELLRQGQGEVGCSAIQQGGVTSGALANVPNVRTDQGPVRAEEDGTPGTGSRGEMSRLAKVTRG